MRFSKIQPWVVCFSSALFFFYEFFQMGMFNSISLELMHDFSISARKLGFLSASYFYADVLFLLLAGLLVDRFSVRTVILSAMTMVIFATIIFALSHSFQLAAFSHFLAGIGNAFCFISCIKLATRWFSSQRLAFVIGLIVTIAMIGGVTAQTPFTLLVQALGWRKAVLVNAFIGIFITFFIYLFVYDFPRSCTLQERVERATPSTSVKKSVIFVFLNKQNSLAGVYTCLLNLPIVLLGALWGTLYLMQTHYLEKTEASFVTTMIYVGTIIGSPLMGWLSDYLARRRILMLIGPVLALFVLLIIMFFPNLSFFLLIILFLLLGFFTSTQILSYPLIAESNPKHLTGTATSLASILIMSGGAVFQPLFGWLIDLDWDGGMVEGNPLYSPVNYLYGMMIIPLAFILSLVVAFYLRETYCQASRETNLC